MKPKDLVTKFRQEAERMERLYKTFAHLQPAALLFFAESARFRQAANGLEETIARMDDGVFV